MSLGASSAFLRVVTEVAPGGVERTGVACAMGRSLSVLRCRWARRGRERRKAPNPPPREIPHTLGLTSES